MILETGIVGGVLVLAIVVGMWKQATLLRLTAGGSADLALKAAIVTSLVGGMGGEYYYGGIIMFSLFAVYSTTGGAPAMAHSPVRVLSRINASAATATRPTPLGAVD